MFPRVWYKALHTKSTFTADKQDKLHRIVQLYYFISWFQKGNIAESPAMKAFLFDSNVPLHWRGRLRLQAEGSGCLKQHNWFDGQTEMVQIQYSQMNARHARIQK